MTAPTWAHSWITRNRDLTPDEIEVLRDAERYAREFVSMSEGVAVEGLELQGPAANPLVVILLRWENERPGWVLGYRTELVRLGQDGLDIAMNAYEWIATRELPHHVSEDGVAWLGRRQE